MRNKYSSKKRVKNMDDTKNKMGSISQSEEDLGFLLWQLESLEKFYPCYNTMIKKE
jgi:hypothetical protein